MRKRFLYIYQETITDTVKSYHITVMHHQRLSFSTHTQECRGLLVSGQDEDILHEVLQGGLCGDSVVHEGSLQGVILVIADDAGWQSVVAHKVCNDASCMHSTHSLYRQTSDCYQA